MEELSPTSTKTTFMCKVKIEREEYIVVRESKSIFRGAAFLQFRGQKIAADGVSRQAHRQASGHGIKKLYEQGLKNHADVWSVDKARCSY